MAGYQSPGVRCKPKNWGFETFSRMRSKNSTRKNKRSGTPVEWACMACPKSFTMVFSLLFSASGILMLKGAEEKLGVETETEACLPIGALSILLILWLLRWCRCFPEEPGWLFNFAPDTHFNHSSLNMLSLHGHVLGLSECTSKFSSWYLDISILLKWPDLHYHCGDRKNPIMQW